MIPGTLPTSWQRRKLGPLHNVSGVNSIPVHTYLHAHTYYSPRHVRGSLQLETIDSNGSEQCGLTARMTQPQPTHLECQGRRQPQRQGDTDPSRGPRCGRHHTRASCRLYYCACCFEVADTWVSLSPLMSHRGLSNTNQRLSRVAERERESRIAVFLIQTNVSLPKAVPSRAPKCLSLST